MLGYGTCFVYYIFNWFLAGGYFWKGYSLFWIIWKCNFVLTSWLPALWRLQYTSILLFIQVCQLLVQKHQSDYIRMHSNKLEQPIKTKTYFLLTLRYITKYLGLTFHNMKLWTHISPDPPIPSKSTQHSGEPFSLPFGQISVLHHSANNWSKYIYL